MDLMEDDEYEALEDATVPMTPAEILAFLLPQAEAGNAAAQCLLADAYDLGQVGERDAVRSVHWYRLSAAQGYMRAEYFLGSMLDSGIGTERDPVEAMHWMRIVAAKGDSAAQYCVADLLLADGADDAGRTEEAIAFLTLSAAQGNAAAIARLGTLRKQRSSSAL